MSVTRTSILIGVLAASFLCVALPVVASAEIAGKTVEISQEDFDESGDPLIVANAVPEGGKPILWQQCDGLFVFCSDYPIRGDVFEPGETGAGQAFTARLASKPAGEILHSHIWGGRVTPVGPPSLDGAAVVGTRVRPLAGQWTGGWGSEYDRLAIAACQTPQAEDCDFISGADSFSRSANKGGVIGAYYEGWGLYVIDQRTSNDAVFAAILFGPRRPNPALKPMQAKSISEFLGPIAGRSDYGATVPKHLFNGGRTTVVAHVRCPGSCKASVALRAVAPKQRSPLQYYPFSWTTPETTRIHKSGAFRRSHIHLREGRLVRVSVWINGVLAADEIARVR